jgi:plastocyanin domain-containing protein
MLDAWRNIMQWLNSIAPTLIGLIGASIGWFLKSKFEAKKQAEEALRDERAKIYVDILMPFA